MCSVLFYHLPVIFRYPRTERRTVMTYPLHAAKESIKVTRSADSFRRLLTAYSFYTYMLQQKSWDKLLHFEYVNDFGTESNFYTECLIVDRYTLVKKDDR